MFRGWKWEIVVQLGRRGGSCSARLHNKRRVAPVVRAARPAIEAPGVFYLMLGERLTAPFPPPTQRPLSAHFISIHRVGDWQIAIFPHSSIERSSRVGRGNGHCGGIMLPKVFFIEE